jgi:ssDNA-binding replication factor A large subunit
LVLSEEEQSSGSEFESHEIDRAKIFGNPSRFELLQSELARLRPDLTREKIAALVQEKKSKVGGGFLTDQGALFLIASDLGVTLKPIVTDTIRLSDLQPDSIDLSIKARILTLGSPKIIQRKEDASHFFLMKIVLYDLTSTIAMNLWSEFAASALVRSGILPGKAVRIQGAFTRRGKDNSRYSLSLSDRGKILEAEENDPQFLQIPKVSELAIGLSQLRTVPQDTGFVIRGNISGQIRFGQFRRRDETMSRYVSFGLSENNNQDPERDKEVRVVIWDNSDPAFEKLRIGESITLLNVKQKITEYLGNNSLELHGDDTSHILEHWDETRIWLENKLGPVSMRTQKSENLKNGISAKVQTAPAFVSRILSIGQTADPEETTTTSHLLLIDSSKRRISVTVQKDALSQVKALKVDDVVVCRPDTFDQIGLRATCSKSDSIFKVKPERNDIPKSSSMVSEIAKLEANSVATIDCMVLTVSPSREIQTKEGPVKRSEALLADPSGETKLYAWRDLSKYLDRLSAGDRLWLYACEVQSHEGKKFLLLKNYSRIELQKG